MKRWECTVCGYIHVGEEPPDTCPVCGADKSMFVEMVETVSEEKSESEPVAVKDSVAMAESPAQNIAPPVSNQMDGEIASHSKWGKLEPLIDQIRTRMVRYHVHPISVHIPNGVLPVSAIFLVLAMMFHCPELETAAFYNLIVVVLSMPLVLFSGYNDWQKRYRGNISNLFLGKMICGGIVSGLGIFLVIWRLVSPGVVLSESSSRWVYLFVYLMMLAAAVIAGMLGGKLVFPNSGKR